MPDTVYPDVFSGFASGEGPVDAALSCHFCRELPSLELRAHELVFDSGSLWRLYERGDTLIYEERLSPAFPPRKLGIFRAGCSQGDVYVKLYEDMDFSPYFPWGYPLALVSTICVLARHGGLMLHACAVQDGERGYLFAGNSTHGKSTMARIWQDHARVLGDDRIIVRLVDGRPWMYGTPWHGDCPVVSPLGLPIERVFFLRHAARNEAVATSRLEAATMLLTRCFPPFWDGAGMAAAIELCDTVAQCIPCAELGFVPDESVIEYVRNWTG